jgi:hypothetical protein
MTVGEWLDANVTSSRARSVFVKGLSVDPAQTSLLHFLWWLARVGEYAFEWAGDRWSQGCGLVQLPPGILSTVGHSWRAPIGRLVWAGADTGDQLLEGAVRSGQRAAREAIDLLADDKTKG